MEDWPVSTQPPHSLLSDMKEAKTNGLSKLLGLLFVEYFIYGIGLLVFMMMILFGNDASARDLHLIGCLILLPLIKFCRMV
ncbi:hypothetical protein PENTCL1PPCAC_23066, partial [Pristionchus entomophagus]